MNIMITNEQEWYCKLFVDFNGDEKSLLDLISHLSGGKRNIIRTIESDNLVIDVMNNDDHNDTKYGKPIPWGALNEFLFYKYFLDIFPADKNVNEDAYIRDVGDILEKLWAKGYKAVAACDFEDRLPRKAGRGYDPTGKTIFKE